MRASGNVYLTITIEKVYKDRLYPHRGDTRLQLPISRRSFLVATAAAVAPTVSALAFPRSEGLLSFSETERSPTSIHRSISELEKYRSYRAFKFASCPA
jgi:hypothetical protein